MKRFILAGILVLFVLAFSAPCFADDGITITIVAGEDKASSSVAASGEVRHIITDKERTSFNIEDAKLKEAVAAHFGKKPNDAYLHSPTPWHDLYKKFNWEQVHTVLKVKKAEILGITSEPSIVKTVHLKNPSKIPVTQSVSISETIRESMTNTWSESSRIEVNQKFNYGVAVQGETTLNYSHTWGKSQTESKDVTVSSTQAVSVNLEPGQAVDACLTASKGTMKIRITYEASLTGMVATNYGEHKYKGHHFWEFDINTVMQAAKLPTTIEIHEDIEVGYYSNGSIETRDPVKGVVLHKSRAHFIR